MRNIKNNVQYKAIPQMWKAIYEKIDFFKP